MTGINSDLSVSGRKGVELATEEFNKAGGLNGRKIELVVKDDKNDTTTALNIDKFGDSIRKYMIFKGGMK